MTFLPALYGIVIFELPPMHAPTIIHIIIMYIIILRLHLSMRDLRVGGDRKRFDPR